MKLDDAGVAPRVHASWAHDSSAKQVCGEAIYIDDLPEPEGTLQVYVAQSPHPHARIRRIDASKILAERGVVAVLTAADVPGEHDISCIRAGDEPVFARDLVEYAGQAVFAVAAPTIDIARSAARKVIVDYEPLEPILTIAQAMQKWSFVLPPRVVRRGDP